MPVTTVAVRTTRSSRCSDVRVRGAVAMAVLLATVLASCARREPAPLSPTAPPPAPDSFLVAFETTVGRIVVAAHRNWSPHGVDRFHALVTDGFYDDTRFFRVVTNFVAQFGLAGDSAANEPWRRQFIPDDSVRTSNRRGTLAFARGGPGTRSTQLFVNLRDNPRLDTLNGFGFPPIGTIVEGLPLIDSLEAQYGEGPPRGEGPSQDSIRRQGNAYLDRRFPALDGIRTARIVQVWE